VGLALPIPGIWIAIVSVVVLALGVRAGRRMNQPAPVVTSVPQPLVADES
jgi:hypothetical protein